MQIVDNKLIDVPDNARLSVEHDAKSNSASSLSSRANASKYNI